MNMQEQINTWKQDPEFVKNVGMILCHNGIVRGTSRDDKKEVIGVRVTPDHAKIEAIRAEFENNAPGIYRVAVKAFGGDLKPGDDLLYILVAGDIRENVKAALSELLDRIKSEAVSKQELLAADA
jgi:molybdopterin synthase catalytic subunit